MSLLCACICVNILSLGVGCGKAIDFKNKPVAAVLVLMSVAEDAGGKVLVMTLEVELEGLVFIKAVAGLAFTLISAGTIIEIITVNCSWCQDDTTKLHGVWIHFWLT